MIWFSAIRLTEEIICKVIDCLSINLLALLSFVIDNAMVIDTDESHAFNRAPGKAAYGPFPAAFYPVSGPPNLAAAR